MSASLVVRLHDDVEVGPVVIRDGRGLRLSRAALAELDGREVVADTPMRHVLADRLLDLGLAHVVDGPVRLTFDDVTLVVPVRNNASGVGRLLGLMAGQVSCIVVDDASDDAAGLAEVVDRHGARLVRLERNLGPAGARNTGASLADSPFVAFVDSDVIADPSALEGLLGEFADPQVSAVAPRVRSRDGRRWFQRYEDSFGSLDLGKRSAAVRAMSDVAYVPSAVLLLRKAHFPPGGFDRTLRCAEDVDLVWRLLDAGLRVRYVAEVHVWHEHRPSLRAWLARQAFYGTGAALLADRHGKAVAPAVVSWPSAVAMVAGASLRPWSLPVMGVLLVRAWRRTGRELPEASEQQRLKLMAFGVSANAKQVTGLLLRHWWPVSAVLATRSGRFRWLLAVVTLADAVLAYRARPSTLDLLRFALGRRLTDLAYGAGVWWGAGRARSIRCLTPARSRRMS